MDAVAIENVVSLKLMSWALAGVLGFVVTVLLLVGRAIASSLGKKIDKLINVVETLGHDNVRHNERIKTLYNLILNQKQDLKDLSDRVDDVERKQLLCRNYKDV